MAGIKYLTLFVATKFENQGSSKKDFNIHRIWLLLVLVRVPLKKIATLLNRLAIWIICILTKLIKISYLKDKMKVMINEIIRKKYGKFQSGSFGKKKTY